METTIVIITQYYRVRNGNPSYCLERQKEVDFCLIQNCENPFIDQIHLLLEEEVDLSFLPEKHIQKITKKLIKNRLTYEYAFQYYNDYLTNTICILQNADIYTDETIEILKHVKFDMKVVLALNRYETNNHLMNGLCNNDYSEHSSNYLIPYQASIWSQDAWVWKTKDAIVIPESHFELGIVGCDNYIATLFKENGYHVMNSSYLVCTNHHDHLSIEKTDYGLSKGNVSRKTTNRIKCPDKYLFLQNIKDIPDQYTQAINHEYSNHSNHSKTQYTTFQKTIHEIVLEEHQITASSFSNKHLKPVFSKFNNESYWEPHEDDYEPFIEYDFSQTEELVILDIQGKKVDRKDINFGYVTEFKVKYFLDQVWYEGGTHKGITVEQGNYVKRIYFSETITCQKIRIYPTKYRNICAMKLCFYSYDFPNNLLQTMIDNPFIQKTKNKYEYTIFMHIYDLFVEKNTEKNIQIFLEKNRDEILSCLSTKKIHYNYYKYFDLESIRIIFEWLNLDFYENIREYIPPYKLILCKNEYKKYGIHRYGWQNVIDHFLYSNYSENDDFHYMYPNFEWIKYAYFYHLNGYKASVEHYMRNKMKTYEDYYYIDAIIFDDWLEKTYNWKGVNHKDESKFYKISFLSFIHDPYVDDLTKKVQFTSCIDEKLKRNKNYLTDNEYFLKEKKNCKIIFTLTEDLKQNTERRKLFEETIIKSVKHPMNEIHFKFNINNYIKNKTKSVYFIGWWLRKYDTFLKIKSLNHTKKILIKNTEGQYIEDYVFYELRKTLCNNFNNSCEITLNSHEIELLETKYNTSILNYLENSEYDKIFTDNIVFIELYATSANNIVLECIMTNTPLLINYSDAVVEYLGKDYPFYFHSLEEAEQKMNDMDVIIDAHNYLRELDKKVFSYETFNKNVCRTICDYFLDLPRIDSASAV